MVTHVVSVYYRMIWQWLHHASQFAKHREGFAIPFWINTRLHTVTLRWKWTMKSWRVNGAKHVIVGYGSYKQIYMYIIIMFSRFNQGLLMSDELQLRFDEKVKTMATSPQKNITEKVSLDVVMGHY